MGVNGVAAANRLRGFTNLQHGMCLFYVWQAYKAEGAQANGTYPTALAGWHGSPGKHEGDRNPPAGVPVWFGAKSSSSAGDVVISLGDGRVVATDYPRYGVVGVCTIQERQDQIGRPYLGWTETILGAAIDFAGGGQPANVGGGQRTAGANGVRRRSAPSSQSAEAGEMLPPGTVGNFTGWKRGEAVDGNDVWFQGTSGNWFWSGGFVEGANTAGLADLNAATPPASGGQRTVLASSSVNGRSAPSTSAAIVQSLDAGDTGTFNGYARGENVNGVDVWFRGAIAGNWFWAGGFTSQATDGLELVDVGSTPAPTPTPSPGPTKDANNPRGLAVTVPVYPGADFGLDAPLGNQPRGQKGIPPVAVPVIIDRFILHRTGSDGDELDWFSQNNSRSSCPSWYIRKDGTVFELIRPKMKPSLTGPEWNWRTVGVELQGAGNGTQEQFEAVAQLLAWLASFDGQELDGVPVDFQLDREHFIDHREVQATECPGEWWHSRMDALLERAKAWTTPPPSSSDTVTVERKKLEYVYDLLGEILGK